MLHCQSPQTHRITHLQPSKPSGMCSRNSSSSCCAGAAAAIPGSLIADSTASPGPATPVAASPALFLLRLLPSDWSGCSTACCTASLPAEAGGCAPAESERPFSGSALCAAPAHLPAVCSWSSLRVSRARSSACPGCAWLLAPLAAAAASGRLSPGGLQATARLGSEHESDSSGAARSSHA
jgi:hypothetical protein